MADEQANIIASDDNVSTNDDVVAKVTKPKPVKKYAATRKTVDVVFKQNRKFDLHVGREVVVFLGREIKAIPREWLDHADFRQVQKYFVIKGV